LRFVPGQLRPSATTIVVADDQAFSRRLIRSALSGLGKVVECRTGFEAIEMVEQQRPSLLIIGSRLVGLDGAEVTQLLRRSKTGIQFTPVILVSGRTTQSSVLGAVTAGVHEYVARPFSMKTLRTRAEAVLTRPRPFVRTRIFFGPVPRAKKVRGEVLGDTGEKALAKMICGVRLEPANATTCYLGLDCICRTYVSGLAAEPSRIEI
jgi:two-component system, chemotaxis family, chemotaxis protein CheY